MSEAVAAWGDPLPLDPVVRDWRCRRSELTHDWVGNRLLPRLRAGASILESGLASQRSTLAALLDILDEWPARSDEALQLIDDYCAVMSPLRLADSVLLALPVDVARFVRYTGNACWRRRHRVAAGLDELRAAQRRAQASYERWLRRGSKAKASAATLLRMASACERLARGFSQLPGRVLL